MFPLAGKDFPTSGGQLANALTGALTELFALSKSGAAVSVDGDFPNMTRIAINLDNANVAINGTPPKPIGIGKCAARIHRPESPDPRPPDPSRAGQV